MGIEHFPGDQDLEATAAIIDGGEENGVPALGPHHPEIHHQARHQLRTAIGLQLG